MSDTNPKHPNGEAVKIENDYYHNGVTDPDDPQFRWNGPDPRKRDAALTPAQLDEIRARAPKTQPTFAERQFEARRTGIAVKPSVVVIGKNGTEKIQ
jgi:hypothetical protein